MPNLEKFILFDPLKGKSRDIPNVPGNYYVLLRTGSTIPNLGESLAIPQFYAQDLIYTGTAGKSLRKRIYSQHLGKNAGNSTLRQSLGCLFGYEQIKRDSGKNDIPKFKNDDELELLAWMKANLIFFYLPNETPKPLEAELIVALNPPLNLQGNHNPVNIAFRKKLNAIRSIKPWRQ